MLFERYPTFLEHGDKRTHKRYRRDNIGTRFWSIIAGQNRSRIAQKKKKKKNPASVAAQCSYIGKKVYIALEFLQERTDLYPSRATFSHQRPRLKSYRRYKDKLRPSSDAITLSLSFSLSLRSMPLCYTAAVARASNKDGSAYVVKERERWRGGVELPSVGRTNANDSRVLQDGVASELPLSFLYIYIASDSVYTKRDERTRSFTFRALSYTHHANFDAVVSFLDGSLLLIVAI